MFTRVLFNILGTIAVSLGVIGIFIPVMPTTPFLLLAAMCYARGSQRLHRWLLSNRWCGAYIRNYREDRSMHPRHKLLTLSLLWITITLSGIFAVELWWVRIILFVVAIGVTTHILRLPARAD
jgi:uncharacterized membrane protein YbaN (DUF454 family)